MYETLIQEFFFLISNFTCLLYHLNFLSGFESTSNIQCKIPNGENPLNDSIDRYIYIYIYNNNNNE